MVSTEMIIWLGMVIIGFAFLLISFFGGVDHDVSGDVGIDHDIAGSVSPGLSPLSMPMIAAFLVTAGAMGAIMTSSGTDISTTAIYAVVVGIVVFLGAFVFVAKFLGDAQSSSLVHEKEYEGKTGVVTQTIPEEGVGAVALTARGTRYVVTAKSEGRKIPMGANVLIKRVDNSIALVEEMKSQ
jgi:membrane protein implicated in regulation of membrane protease activity